MSTIKYKVHSITFDTTIAIKPNDPDFRTLVVILIPSDDEKYPRMFSDITLTFSGDMIEERGRVFELNQLFELKALKS